MTALAAAASSAALAAAASSAALAAAAVSAALAAAAVSAVLTAAASVATLVGAASCLLYYFCYLHSHLPGLSAVVVAGLSVVVVAGLSVVVVAGLAERVSNGSQTGQSSPMLHETLSRSDPDHDVFAFPSPDIPQDNGSTDRLACPRTLASAREADDHRIKQWKRACTAAQPQDWATTLDKGFLDNVNHVLDQVSQPCT